jgi:hypothetical protein
VRQLDELRSICASHYFRCRPAPDASRACASAASFIQARDISSLGRTSTKVGAHHQRHLPRDLDRIELVAAVLEHFLLRRLVRWPLAVKRQRRRASTANVGTLAPRTRARRRRAHELADPRHNVGAGGEARKAAARQAVVAALQQRPEQLALSASRDTRTIRLAVPISTCIVTNRLALSWLSCACRCLCCSRSPPSSLLLLANVSAASLL